MENFSLDTEKKHIKREIVIWDKCPTSTMTMSDGLPLHTMAITLNGLGIHKTAAHL